MGSILVPLNDANMVSAYAEAGADEFYLGFYDPAWTAAFGPYVDLNRMSGFGNEANAYSFAEALGVVQVAKSLDKRVFVTFNAAGYSARALDMIYGYFSSLAATGADGVILSGPELVDMAVECGLSPVASTMCGVYNREIARFYETCGVQRMIVPRDLSLAEIGDIAKSVPDVEFEVFCMRNGCVYSDSHCLGMHGHGRGALCGEMRAAERRVRSAGSLDETITNSDLHCHAFHQHACGLCALWDFEQMGIAAYKVVGRSDQTDAILEDITTIAAELEIARECDSREAYLERMMPHPYEAEVCVNRLNCYYPEVARL